MVRNNKIPTKCVRCDCDLYIGKQRNYIYWKGNYVCKKCWNIPKIGKINKT